MAEALAYRDPDINKRSSGIIKIRHRVKSSEKKADFFNDLIFNVLRFFQESQIAVFKINEYNRAEEFVNLNELHYTDVKKREDYVFILKTVEDYDNQKQQPVYRKLGELAVQFEGKSRINDKTDVGRDYASSFTDVYVEYYELRLNVGWRVRKRIRDGLWKYLKDNTQK